MSVDSIRIKMCWWLRGDIDNSSPGLMFRHHIKKQRARQTNDGAHPQQLKKHRIFFLVSGFEKKLSKQSIPPRQQLPTLENHVQSSNLFLQLDWRGPSLYCSASMGNAHVRYHELLQLGDGPSCCRPQRDSGLHKISSMCATEGLGPDMTEKNCPVCLIWVEGFRVGGGKTK